MLGNLYKREGLYEDALYCYAFLRGMADALYHEEKYRPSILFNHHPMFNYPAFCLMKLGRGEEAITLLEEGVQFILSQAESIHGR